MYADGVDIFNKAYCDDVVFSITDNFKLKLFPTADTLLNENLSNE